VKTKRPTSNVQRPTSKAEGAIGLIKFRAYQEPIFRDHESKTVILHWSRQIGKSYTLAAWAVDRLLRFPGRLVTVLSNSRDNGAEFVIKAEEICRALGVAIEGVETESNADELNGRQDLSEDLKYEAMRFEIKITVGGITGRIKVLAANPRTARGFSGDLILDEFAFHEDSQAIWEAAEPIISSNPDFLCRISSTGNGKRNMFYQLVSRGDIPYNRMRRSDAHAMGALRIHSIISGKEITPDEARRQSADKRAYDQNYECTFADENAALLTQELISAAERAMIPIDEQEWSVNSLQRMHRAEGDIYVGQDFARVGDLSVQAVFEKVGRVKRMIGLLTMQEMRIKQQFDEFERLGLLPKFRRACFDMTGNGLGLFEMAEEKFGTDRIEGVNFSSTEPVTDRIRSEGRKAPTAKVTEIMATNLVAEFEDKTIEITPDPALRDDLRKPEKITSPGGRVSIAAARDVKDHADRFWAIALAIRAAGNHSGPFHYQAVERAAGKFKKRRALV
jgi:phage FluMu gp28-like protein